MDMYEENHYSKLFQGCIALTECPKFNENFRQEVEQETINVKFDDFDWEENSKIAFEK